MDITTFGKIGLGLGIIMLVLAFGQPVTVSDTQTTCIGYDCSTVEYERPNPIRGQLFGAAIFLITGSGILYAIGSRSTPTQSAPAKPPTASQDESSDEGSQISNEQMNPGTLREQLEAKQATGEEVETEPRHAGTQDVTDHRSATTAVNTESPVSNSSSRQLSPLTGDLSGFAVVSGIALLSAYLSSFVLSTVITLDSSIFRAIVFSFFALPGLALYWRVIQDKPSPQNSDSLEGDI